MGHILQQKINDVLKGYSGILADLKFKIDTQKYLESVFIEEKIEDEATINVMQEATEKLNLDFPREGIAKSVAESLGVSVMEFLSMPTETSEKFIQEKKLALENEAITKYCKELKEQMTNLGLLKNPEEFDTLEFLAKIIILINN